MIEWNPPHTLLQDASLRVTTERWLRESLTLLSSCDGDRALSLFLDLAMAIQGSDFGNLQVYRKDRRALEIVRQRGFDPDFLHAFRYVTATDACSCGRALMVRKPIVVSDAESDADFSVYWPVVRQAGYRGVQSFPIIAGDELIGVVSTHFRAPGLPPATSMNLASLFVHQSADVLVRKTPNFQSLAS